jgi:hypothetical protein
MGTVNLSPQVGQKTWANGARPVKSSFWLHPGQRTLMGVVGVVGGVMYCKMKINGKTERTEK